MSPGAIASISFFAFVVGTGDFAPRTSSFLTAIVTLLVSPPLQVFARRARARRKGVPSPRPPTLVGFDYPAAVDAMQIGRSTYVKRFTAMCLVLACGCAKTEAEWNRELVAGNPFSRSMAALALSEAAPERSNAAIPVLLDVLDGPDTAVRPHVRRALARIAPFAVREMLHQLATAWHPSDARQGALVEALSDAGAPAVPAMLAAMREPEIAAAPHVDLVLQRIGAPAVDPLVRTLESDPDLAVRRGAAELLGRLGPAARRAVPLLIQSLQGRDPECARAAAESLASIRPDGGDVLEPLRAALLDPSPVVRSAAGGAVVKILILRAAAQKPEERENAAREIQWIGEAALPALVDRAGMRGPERARFARDNLVRIVVRSSFLPRARGAGAQRVSELMLDLTLMDQPVARGLAAIELGRIGVDGAAAVPLLTRATRDRHEGARVAANLGLVLITLDAASKR
jgi:HEAT repeat protein